MDLSQYLSHITSERYSRMKEVLSSRSEYHTFVFENFYDPHNISAGLRSLEGLGFQTVHIIAGKNDMRLNKAITKGCTKWLDIQIHEDTERCFELLKKQGYNILIADPNETGLTIDGLEHNGNIAFVFGEELYGISQRARELCDGSFRIRMRGFIESFNVSVSVALTAFAARLNCESKKDDKWLLSEKRKRQVMERWLIENTIIGKIVGEVKDG